MLTRLCREIIDESDVYIDVHKAIRRLTPAPKARPLRKDIADAASAAAGNGKLIDLDDDEQPQSRNKRVNSVGEHDIAAALSTSPGKTATFLMRRSSAGPDGRMQATTVPVKANLDEIKRQLKHLGPSNRNTNPRDTRSTTVKIKPVMGNANPMLSPSGLRPASIAGEPIETSLDARLEDTHADDNENTPLIRPSQPMITGKGGVQAVRKSYGGAGMSEAQTRLAGAHDVISGVVDMVKDSMSGPQLQMPTISDEAASRQRDSGNSSPTSPVVDAKPGRASSQGSVISIDEGSMTPRRRQIVRSGSISENVVETSSGVRKIIIQAASSDSEDGSTKGSSGSGTIRARLTSMTMSADASPGEATPTQVAPEDGEDDESHEDGINGAPGSANGTSAVGAKKKKKNKKKKAGKA